MSPKEFFDAVRRMRKAQREVEKCNNLFNRRLAKEAEQIIDLEIKRVEVVTHEISNPRLDL